MKTLLEIAKKAKHASYEVGLLTNEERNNVLQLIANQIRANSEAILEANQKDLDAVTYSESKKDRLRLSEERIEAMAQDLESLTKLDDPLEKFEEWTQKDGLKIRKARVPLGVVAVIYEARPNVTTDVAGLCLRSGNVVILKGGSDALNSNRSIVQSIEEALKASGITTSAVQLLDTGKREDTEKLLTLNEYVDVAIPRGGASLIQFVREKSRVPMIETGTGNCHVYVDADADAAMALNIIQNAKMQRPFVCNAAETLLVHEKIADEILPKLPKTLEGVELRGDEATRKILKDIKAATEDDWKKEFLDLILAVKVVKSVEEAVAHINTYGSHHSEAIITENKKAAKQFTQGVDSAAVYVNASTRFTDGAEFGFGAEVGISTQKLHARGPMGLDALTTTKYIVHGEGQVRK